MRAVRSSRSLVSPLTIAAAFWPRPVIVRLSDFKSNEYAALLGGRSDRRRAMNIIHFVEKSVSLATARRRAKAGTLKQLHVKVKRQGGTKPLAGAFIGNKGRTVFERVPGTVMASRSKYAGSLHAEEIRPVQTIGIKQMFNARRVNSVVVQLMRDKFPEIFDREARFYTERFNRGQR